MIWCLRYSTSKVSLAAFICFLRPWYNHRPHTTSHLVLCLWFLPCWTKTMAQCYLTNLEMPQVCASLCCLSLHDQHSGCGTHVELQSQMTRTCSQAAFRPGNCEIDSCQGKRRLALSWMAKWLNNRPVPPCSLFLNWSSSGSMSAETCLEWTVLKTAKSWRTRLKPPSRSPFVCTVVIWEGLGVLHGNALAHFWSELPLSLLINSMNVISFENLTSHVVWSLHWTMGLKIQACVYAYIYIYICFFLFFFVSFPKLFTRPFWP